MDDDNIIKESKYNITTDKNNKMELYLRYYENEEISISIYPINQIPSIKYELKCNLEEFQKNRFFKIFNNIEELMLELDSKIEKSTILEETNLLILDIPIGLKIINDILLEIKIVEKNELETINELKEINNKLNLNIKKLENEIKQISKQNKELNKENQNLKNKIKNNNFSNEKIIKEKENIIIEKNNKINQILKEKYNLNEENKQIKNLKNEIQTKNNDINKLKNNIEKLQIKIKDYENQNNKFNGNLTKEEVNKIYNELDDLANIHEKINFDLFNFKLKKLLKNEKENYELMKKDEIINHLKDKMLELIYP